MITSAPRQAVRRIARDFAAGVFAFVTVAACVVISEGQAAGNADLAASWVTTVSEAPKSAFMAQIDAWHVTAMALLTLTVGALTAFNLSLARHVRTVAADTPAAPELHAAQK